jgi:hypothetical protein
MGVTQSMTISKFQYDKKWFGVGLPDAWLTAPWHKESIETDKFYPDLSGSVNYKSNSKGYRDVEWSPDDLNNSIWCVGHSDVAGMGVDYNSIWPVLLEKSTGIKTVNLGIIGGSWDTISRVVSSALTTHKPRFICIQATMRDRREYITNERQQVVLPSMEDERQVDLNFWKFIDEENSQYSLEKNITIIDLACRVAGVQYIIFDFADRRDIIRKYPAADGKHIGAVPHRMVSEYLTAELKKHQLD